MNSTLTERIVAIDAGGVEVIGTLTTPVMAHGLVVFVQEALGPADLDLERAFERRGLATLRLDLTHVTDLAAATIAVIDWLRADGDLAVHALGLFGSGEGAAAAVSAAAHRPHDVSALVLRDGHLDGSVRSVAHVHAPTLLLAGALDRAGLSTSRSALAELRHGALSIVPNASRRFEEPGALDAVARVAGTWFVDHLSNRKTELHAV